MSLIKGNSGLGHVGMFHASASYDSNGMVFVEAEICDCPSWERMPLEEAEKENKTIIKCNKEGCGKNADVLDHHYPYYNDHTLCRKHYEDDK